MGQDSHRHAAAICPRCGGPLHEPTAWSSAWRCDWHGEVDPLLPAFGPSRDGLDGLLRILQLGAAHPRDRRAGDAPARHGAECGQPCRLPVRPGHPALGR